MKTPIFTGSCTAMITPFTHNGINYKRFGFNIDYQAEHNTDALLICGTTGENATQSKEEHSHLLQYAAQHNAGRMKMIAGIGSNCTEKALYFGKIAEENNYDGVLMVTPYYNKTTQAGLIKHFTYVADRIKVPLILYNVPSRTGIGITVDTYKVLAQHPNINGVKEASGDFSLFSRTRAVCQDDLNIWSGNDDNTVGMMALGAKGVISVASNIIPKQIAELCHACLCNDFQKAEQIHMQYESLFTTLFVETNPIPVKTAMHILGMDDGIFRLPLTEMQKNNVTKLKECLYKVGLYS